MDHNTVCHASRDVGNNVGSHNEEKQHDEPNHEGAATSAASTLVSGANPQPQDLLIKQPYKPFQDHSKACPVVFSMPLCNTKAPMPPTAPTIMCFGNRYTMFPSFQCPSTKSKVPHTTDEKAYVTKIVGGTLGLVGPSSWIIASEMECMNGTFSTIIWQMAPSKLLSHTNVNSFVWQIVDDRRNI
ncbi:unnamed protein product [Phytophthora lilii]|uniref:Unnamed protein product n=1 Tax=Phytophthora lilii TaxID=2077276 RepID=A0A9W6WKZ7_9STRA|nr:unnamed protein product [Phytophthora lilii]